MYNLIEHFFQNLVHIMEPLNPKLHRDLALFIDTIYKKQINVEQSIEKSLVLPSILGNLIPIGHVTLDTVTSGSLLGSYCFSSNRTRP